jgi:primosomal protein N' (replication factor Y)
MHFYEIWVKSNRYRGNKSLTYNSIEPLKIGQLVIVPLKQENVIGVVVKETLQPRINTKSILRMIDLPPLPKKTLKLMNWLKAYYPSGIGIITQQFIPANVVNISTYTDTLLLKNDIKSKLPDLTKEQLSAIKQMNARNTYLLHGRTGSGKTRIYLELALQELANGKSSIILTPEISLTAQLESVFKNILCNNVVVLHSTLTPKQRAERWIKLLKCTAPLIVIGPRSVIFSPLPNIGLIVIDEEHEPAYKQEQAPYYVTGRVAAEVRILHDAKLVLGTATPLVSDYFLAQTMHKPIIRLDSLAIANRPYGSKVIIVDLHNRSLLSRSTLISDPLLAALQNAISKNEQAMLYLNRRGTARVIVCSECDWQAMCPHCDLPLTYHDDSHSLRCHVCGYRISAPTTCPKCNNPSVRYLSAGTKAIVNEIKRLFPDARVGRFDSDNSKAERLEQKYLEIKDGHLDIIVGTQLLAKGLDLPGLSVVGVLMADSSLQLPDYTVNERTYQLLSQVIGRVGRGHRMGTAVIQTFQPESLAITAAASNNWEEFYAWEIKERKQFGFPPFTNLLKLTVSRSSVKNARIAAEKLKQTLPGLVQVNGPAPAFHEKQGDKYRWQLIVKADKRSKLLEIIHNLPSGVSWDIDPSDLI